MSCTLWTHNDTTAAGYTPLPVRCPRGSRGYRARRTEPHARSTTVATAIPDRLQRNAARNLIRETTRHMQERSGTDIVQSGQELRRLRRKLTNSSFVLLVGAVARHLRKDRVAGYESTGRHYPKTVTLQGLSQFQQGIVVIPIAVDGHRYRSGVVPPKPLQSTQGRRRNTSRVNRDSDHEHTAAIDRHLSVERHRNVIFLRLRSDTSGNKPYDTPRRICRTEIGAAYRIRTHNKCFFPGAVGDSRTAEQHYGPNGLILKTASPNELPQDGRRRYLLRIYRYEILEELQQPLSLAILRNVV